IVAAMSADLLTRLSSADVFVQKLDMARDAMLLVQLSEAGYRNASFLDDRILTPGLSGGWFPTARVIEAARTLRGLKPLHFIFHTGHVGSTLVSRLLDETGIVLSLREPLPLRTLADAADVLDLPESLLSRTQYDALQAALVLLWRRAYDRTHSVVLKATSSASRLAPSLLERGADSRAIYLNLDAEPHIATLLAGKNSLSDLRGHGPGRIRRLQSRLEVSLAPLHTLSVGEFAAMSWLVETLNQRDAVQRFPERVVAVDFDDFLADVAGGLERIVTHLQLPCDSQRVLELARGPVLSRYSKAPDAEYSPGLRRQLLDQARRQHGEEIRRGQRWLEALAKSRPVVAELLRAA
ncbi:MAG: hypothetical protein ACREUC_24245, partial [Steroidobacteraceae bacterium]